MVDGPDRAAGFVEHVVDFQPGRFDHAWVLAWCGLLGVGVAGQVGVQALLANAGREALRKRAEALFHHRQPVGQVVGAGEELGVVFVVVAEPIEISLDVINGLLVLAFR